MEKTPHRGGFPMRVTMKEGRARARPSIEFMRFAPKTTPEASYWSSWSTPCGTWFAWASMACADWIRMLFLV